MGQLVRYSEEIDADAAAMNVDVTKLPFWQQLRWGAVQVESSS
jgi:hypothetical protein